MLGVSLCLTIVRHDKSVTPLAQNASAFPEKLYFVDSEAQLSRGEGSGEACGGRMARASCARWRAGAASSPLQKPAIESLLSHTHYL